MYLSRCRPGDSAGLGALPTWLKAIAGAVVRGVQVTVPTPVGPQTFDLNNPAHRAQLETMARGTRVSVKPPQDTPSPTDRINDAVSQVPGGWLGVLGGVFGAFLLYKSMSRRG